MSEASAKALQILRSGDNMQWYVVPLVVLLVYVYANEIERKNWSAVTLGVATWAGELIWEMFNALVLKMSGYAPLWSAPGETAYLIYVGLNIEIEFFFAIAGVIVVKLLPEDKDMKIFGIPNRIFIPVVLGIICVFVEVLLNQAGLLVWDYWWWSWPHIYLILFVYTLPWYVVAWCHDNLSLKGKVRGMLMLVPAAIVLHVLLANIPGWI